jgi:hypothetical protein
MNWTVKMSDFFPITKLIEITKILKSAFFWYRAPRLLSGVLGHRASLVFRGQKIQLNNSTSQPLKTRQSRSYETSFTNHPVTRSSILQKRRSQLYRWKKRTGKGNSCLYINPFRSYVEPRPTVWYFFSAPMSEDVRHCFCCVCSPAVGACPTLFLM